MSYSKSGSIAGSNAAQRDSRPLTSWFEGLFYDLRFALRALRRDRSFALAAIAMLALAIGLNATVFTVMDAMLFRGHPLVRRSDRVLFLQEHGPSHTCCISYADFEDWRAAVQTFEGLALVGGRAVTFRDGGGRPLDMRTTTVSVNTFGLLGVPPMLGRDFAPSDALPGAAPVLILNYRFWESRFGKRAAVVGSTIHVDAAPATIIGVMPERFDFPLQVSEDFWMPVRTTEVQPRGLTPGGFTVVGRLRDGRSLGEARAELETINRRLEAAYPATNRGIVPSAVTHAQFSSGADAPMIWGSLWAGSCFVLLIACANLTNLTLVRTIGRWRELSTRIALGAGLGRMMRQMFLESLIVTGIAGTLGWWITNWGVRTWSVVTASRYQVLDYTVGSGTIAYLIAITLAAALLCAIAPIVRVVQMNASGALTGDARGASQGRRGKRLAAGLVASQAALAIVLLSGAGVLVRSFMTIVGAETGVRDAEHVLVGLVRLPSVTYAGHAERLAYFDRLAAQLPTVPGVVDSAIASNVPVRGVESRSIEIEGRPTPPDRPETVQFLTVGSGYFDVIGAPAISGRDFNDRDGAEAARVVMVNQSFAALFWPGGDALGKRLRPLDRDQTAGWYTVVGVVPNIMQGDALRQQFKPLVYLTARQNPLRVAFFFARTRVPPGRVAQTVRSRVQALDPDVTIEPFTTLKERFAFERDFMDPDHSELGKHAKVAPIFAGIALLLAAIGLSAVIAHAVTQRTKEIGVRMAIGAAAKDIGTMIRREGMGPVVMGMLLGLAASLAVNRVLQSQLVGVSPYDPLALAGAPVVLTLVALVACQLPARRAMRVDPAVALRHE